MNYSSALFPTIISVCIFYGLLPCSVTQPPLENPVELLAADGSSPFPVSLAGDRACGIQPLGVSRETGNTGSGECTQPHLQVPRNCASSTKVGPLLSEVAVGLGFLSQTWEQDQQFTADSIHQLFYFNRNHNAFLSSSDISSKISRIITRSSIGYLTPLISW